MQDIQDVLKLVVQEMGDSDDSAQKIIKNKFNFFK